MKCPKCGKTGLYKEETGKRKRDGAICVYRICRQYRCGYSYLVSATLTNTVKMDNKKQILFDFA